MSTDNSTRSSYLSTDCTENPTPTTTNTIKTINNQRSKRMKKDYSASYNNSNITNNNSTNNSSSNNHRYGHNQGVGGKGQGRQINPHFEEYIDPLICAPRVSSRLIIRIGEVLDQLANANERLKVFGIQLEKNPELRRSTQLSAIREAELHMQLERKSFRHPWAKKFYVQTHAANYSIQEYFKRLDRYFHCSKESLLLSFIYVDRAITNNRDNICLSYANIHRLILASITCACKYWDDVYYSNAHYARVGGVSLNELNDLEYCMLKLLDYKLYVDVDEYKGYLSMLEENIY